MRTNRHVRGWLAAMTVVAAAAGCAGGSSTPGVLVGTPVAAPLSAAPASAAAPSDTSTPISPLVTTPAETVKPRTVESPAGTGEACKRSFAQMVDGYIHADFAREEAMALTSDPAGRAAIGATLDYLDRLANAGASNADASGQASDSAGPFCQKHPNVVLDVPPPSPIDPPADATSCGRAAGLSVMAGPKTSCPFAREIATTFDEAGPGSGPLSVRSPVTKKTYRVMCQPVPSGFMCTVASSVSTVWLR